MITGMMRPRDQETTAMEEIVGYTHRSQEKGGVPYHEGPHREEPAWSEGRGREGNWGEGLLWFPREGTEEAEKAVLGLSSLNNFSRVWGLWAAPVCLALQ